MQRYHVVFVAIWCLFLQVIVAPCFGSSQSVPATITRSFLQTKLAASVAHHYNQPLACLSHYEGIDASATPAQLIRQVDQFLLSGGESLCLDMHGRDNPREMPYWPLFSMWLDHTEQLQTRMNAGIHVCDLAIIYPARLSEVGLSNEAEQYDFSFAMELSRNGIDFDFIDDNLLIGSTQEGSRLKVDDESFETIVLKDVEVLSRTALERLLAHYRSGGTVIGIGTLPRATSPEVPADPAVDHIMKEIFGMTSAQTETIAAKAQTNLTGGKSLFITDERRLVSLIRRFEHMDFRPDRGGGYVLHRRLPGEDIYLLRGVVPGAECTFRAQGQAQLWNSLTGEITPLKVKSVTEKGTTISLHVPQNQLFAVIFTPGIPTMDTQVGNLAADIPLRSSLLLDGEWEISYVPRQGDTIGPRARALRLTTLDQLDKKQIKEWMNASYNDSMWQEILTPAELLSTPTEPRKQKFACRFETAPGTGSVQTLINGKLRKAWVDGQLIDSKTAIRETEPGLYTLIFPKKGAGVSTVALQVDAEMSPELLFPQPVTLHCTTGVMEVGDWARQGALKYYSGGITYRKKVELTTPEQLTATSVVLQLDQVGIACEVRVNGQRAGTTLYAPYNVEVGTLLKPGVNTLEITVYNTLYNELLTDQELEHVASGLLSDTIELIFNQSK